MKVTIWYAKGWWWCTCRGLPYSRMNPLGRSRVNASRSYDDFVDQLI